MSRNERFAVRATDEAIDTQIATRRVTTLITEVMADGVVTTDEADALLSAARYAEVQADEAATAADCADIGELLSVASLTGIYSPKLLKRARERGMPIIMLSPNLPRRSDDDDEPLRAA